MRFHDNRLRIRADRKARLLAALREHEAASAPVNLSELEIRLECPKTTLRVLWLELAAEGLITGPYATPRKAPAGHVPEAELPARIAAVRHAKIEKRRRERRSYLKEAELEEVLPDAGEGFTRLMPKGETMKMKLTIESTNKIMTIDGVEVRVWEGTTEAGTKCVVMVHRIAVHKDEDASQFERELSEQLPPGRQVPLSNIL